jgi:PmbA protein
MLSTLEAQARVADLVAAACRAGADTSDALYVCNAATQVEVRLGALEGVERSEGEEIGLRAFVGRRSASVSSSDLSAGALTALVDRAIAMAREAPEDAYAGLAPEDRLFRGAAPAVDGDDGGEEEPASLRERARATEAFARGVAGVTNSDGSGASTSRSIIALATSHGFAGGYAVTSHSCSATVIAGSGADMQRDSAYHSARHLADLDGPEAIGRLAGERAVARLAPVRLPGGQMPVVFDPRVGSGLLGSLVGAITGSAVTRRTSFLLDRLGEPVFAPGVTIRDDPLRPRGLRSRPFDVEGVAGRSRHLVEDGVLKTWILDCATARELGLETTGHAQRGVSSTPSPGASNLHMTPGRKAADELIADIADGFYVTDMIGMGVNLVTGDYSRGASGFWIENGECTYPVSEVTIAGHLTEMFASLAPANDLVFRYGTNAPTLRIEGMTVAGQ